MTRLWLPHELDQLLRYRLGKSQRLARKGKIRHIQLPDGSIRFEDSVVRELITKITPLPTDGQVVAHA